MGQFSSFDELPLIVHDGILCSLASPQDVANTIRASPGSLQAFVNGRRNVVLLAALQNYLSLENQHLVNLVMAAPHYYKHGQVLTHTVLRSRRARTNCNSTGQPTMGPLPLLVWNSMAWLGMTSIGLSATCCTTSTAPSTFTRSTCGL